MNGNKKKKKFGISFIKNRYDTEPRFATGTLKELEDFLTEHKVSSTKNGSMISFARFGSRRNEKGGLRHNGNVLDHAGIVIDIDCKFSAPLFKEDIQARLGDAYYIAHTTYSSTRSHPRWHVFIPFSRPVDSAHYTAAFYLFNNRLGKSIDNVSKGLSTAYYLPICPPETASEYQCFVNRGDLFDASALKIGPELGGRGKAKKRRQPNSLREDTVELGPALDVQALPIPDYMRGLILSGDASDFEGDRSRLVFFVVSELMLQGYAANDIATVLLNADYGISARHLEKGQSWTFGELQRIRAKLDHQRYVRDVEPHYRTPKTQLPRHARRALRRNTAAFFQKKNFSLGIRAAAGLGKSTTVVEFITQRRHGEGRVEIYVPSHKLGRELLGILRKEAPHLHCTLIRGRTQADAKGKTLCRRSRAVNQLGEHGVPIYRSLCRSGSEKCVYFHDCPYLEQYQGDDDVRILTHSHLGLERARLEGRKPQLAIIDEAFWPQMIQVQGYPIADIRHSRIQSKKLRVILAKALKYDWPLLETLRGKFGQQLDGLLAQELAQLRDALPVVFPSMPTRQITWIVNQAAPVTFELSLLKALTKEITQFPDRADSLLVRRSSRQTFTLVERTELTRFSGGQGGTDIPVLYIDADLNRGIASVFLPGMKFERIEVKRNAHVTQCYSTRNSKSRFLARGSDRKVEVNVDHLQATQRCLDAICAGQRTLIVSYKDLVDAIQRDESPRLEIPPNCAVEYFGNLRGIDSYKDFDAVVVIGRHQFPISVVENMAIALWWDSSTPLNLTGRLEEELRGYTLKQGKFGVFVQVHSDRRIQGLLEVLRERETLQATDRLRLIHNQQRRHVYILSNLPLPLPVDRLVSWKTLTSAPRRLQRLADCYPDHVIPLSPKFLYARHGDLFSSLAAAKKWCERLQAAMATDGGFGGGHTHSPDGDGDEMYIEIVNRNCHLLGYRLQGESGRKKNCLCPTRMSVTEVKRHLERIHQAEVILQAR